MAEEEGKAVLWPNGAEEVENIADFEFFMAGRKDQPVMKIEKEKLNEFIVVNGEGVKAVAGGATSANPTILRPGPTGANRKMEDVEGWFVNGTAAEPPVATGTPWEAPAGKKNTNWWDGTTWSLGSSVPLPNNPADGIIAAGNTKAISGNEAYLKTILKADIDSVSGKNLFNPDFLMLHTTVSSVGNITTNPAYTYALTIKFPVSDKIGDPFTVSGFTPASNKFWVYKDSANTNVGAVGDLRNTNTVFTPPEGAVYLYLYIRHNTDTSPLPDVMINLGETALPYDEFGEYITGIQGAKIKSEPALATGLLDDNYTPEPIKDKNAVNLGFFNRKAIKDADFTLEFSSNLARQVPNETIIFDKLINSTGELQSSLGWKMYAFYPLRNGLLPEDTFTVGNFTIDSGGYVSWYEGNTLLSFEGSIVRPKTYTVPASATDDTVLYFDLVRPGNVDKFSNLTINKGDVLQPYEVPVVYIDKIKGYDMKSSGSTPISSFEDLSDAPPYAGNANKGLKINAAENGIDVFTPVEQNTDVVFDTVTANSVVVENVPVWDETGTAPVTIGQEYLKADGGGNYFKKVRGV